MLRLLSGCLMIILPLLATYKVGMKKASGDYISFDRQVYNVLMYLDLAMYVLAALALATLFRNIVTYVEQRDKTTFAPALIMTIFTVVVAVINVGIYKTDVQKSNEAVLAQSLQSLQQIDSEVIGNLQLLEGYWAEEVQAGEETRVVIEFDADYQMTFYGRNTGFQKAKICGTSQYEVAFNGAIGELWTTQGDVKSREYIRFQDENTIISIQDRSTGYAETLFKTDPVEKIEFRLTRLTEAELEALREQAKLPESL
ncbi:MAG: hypothetical protein ABS949_11740 [Solibacillus sp.]